MAEVVQQMRNKEIARRAWIKCAKVMGKMHGGGLGNLQVPIDPLEDPKTCKDWHYVEDQKEIEECLCEHFKKHFAQAEETDFRQDPL